ncbi:hypothetical protein MAR_010766 [Mya arenaria]|uniref:Uncharacterized protein n=1 Tax=Mya arenaria TaxID=6604 RepID=A0ABY7FVI2_MYAAR|nr:hypothetical protein MAR_010766 [Mya arenaria]
MYHKQVQISPEASIVFTMTSTMIVPSPQVPCSQWVSFNADNEPVLNTAPQVDDGCDTFLKRLQRTRVQNPSDSSLPSGQQFCFEAMVDKRYNRWKRRRRKKNGDLRRINTVPCLSESSDDNDERTSAVERILDSMYEQIHGPAPHTPNGTRDTPRIRNRRRRNLDGDGNCTPTSQGGNSDEESGSIPLHYDASEEWTSSTDVIGVSSSSGQQPVHQSNSQNYFTYTNTDRCSKYDDSAKDGKLTNKCALSDGHCGSVRVDLCNWPHLEQYKQQIMERIQKTSRGEVRKELYGTQKQNLNLPSLGKNERVQTIPIHSRRDSVVSLQDARKKTSLATPESGGNEARPRTQTTDGGRTAAAERSGQPVPDFLFRDFYLRQLYGKKVRVNSHVESYKNGGRLRKSLTVDGLESGGRKFPRKAVTDVAKPSELRFTRAFTFSMFNLPEMYQLYNTSLEGRALGQGADL